MLPAYLLKYVEIVPMIIMIQSIRTLNAPGSASIRKTPFFFFIFLIELYSKYFCLSII